MNGNDLVLACDRARAAEDAGLSVEARDYFGLAFRATDGAPSAALWFVLMQIGNSKVFAPLELIEVRRCLLADAMRTHFLPADRRLQRGMLAMDLVFTDADEEEGMELAAENIAEADASDDATEWEKRHHREALRVMRYFSRGRRLASIASRVVAGDRGALDLAREALAAAESAGDVSDDEMETHCAVWYAALMKEDAPCGT